MTAIARVCGALIRGDRILMVRHAHDGRSYWTLPGGGVEAGESLAAAACREVHEETGLIVTATRVLFDQLTERGMCRCFMLADSDDPGPPFSATIRSRPTCPPASGCCRRLRGNASPTWRTTCRWHR
ncbi:MAG: NUDIX domain-containing protein [Planctomycetota bacterium]